MTSIGRKRNHTVALRRANLIFVLFWLTMVYPTVFIWGHSVAWVGFLSVWALIVSHLDGYLVGRMESS